MPDYQFKIKRYNPETDKKPHWENYTVQAGETDRLLDGLIKWYHDGTLTFRRSCAHGICGSDSMMINGHNQLACKLIMRDAKKQAQGGVITIEPIRGFPIVKDLVVDMDGFFAKYRAVKPYLINDETPPERERLQSPADRAKFDDTTKCILCAACTTSCPTFWADREYVGPAAIVQAHRFIFDSRDEGTDERMNILGEKGGVYTCRSIYNCVEACPRGIDITKAINEVRQTLLFH